ncbi:MULTISPECIES: S-layer homology domain-containing protein [Cyanophyceae]|uniref:S-layer homology domain-containing protein n=1 Tax=Leptolyngbya subtilissima DQ-A4 TaxID=2933933 RepID=A0ABV0K872_9CYAN|nr:S-layer homology domain-containing protein [Nodosilinea sp. FACHB-141]MBD2110653.1 S-layer homology domain-containing protein [Nodosilinea sp. FACHB-141]
MLQPTSAIASPEQTSGQAGYLPDTEGHWAQPFIQSLTAQNLLKGYPDGTFRPDQPVRRDEFAAILSQSFNQVQEDPIADGSVYNDVPDDHWAKDAIEEAHESGFMSGYPGGLFAPDRDISRTEALVSLSQNLNLEAPPNLNASGAATPAVNNSTASEQSATDQAATNNQAAKSTAANQSSRATQRPRRNTFLMPMALTTLMQPLVAPARARNVPPAANRPAQTPDSANTAAAPNSSAPANTAETPNRTDRAAGDNPEFEALPSEVVSNYYTDAQKIPVYAVDPIATATQAGLVVNYPDRQLLNPDRPATRAEIAAFIHQALVHQGRLAPLADNPAANYIVNPSQSGQ